MKRHGVAFLVIVAMASLDVMASTTAAMLHGNGSVSVNGGAIASTSTVFTGDRIETAPQSAVILTTNGSSILVDQNSSFIFNGENVSFAMGSAVIKTSQGMVAKFQRVVITPGQSATRFQMMQNGRILTVTALEGNLAVLDGRGGEIALASGKQVEIPLDDTTARNDKASAEPDQLPGPTQAHPRPGSLAAGMIAGSGAVASVALTAFVSMSQKQISPIGP